MPLSESSSRAEIYAHCCTYASLTAENTLQNVRQLIQCIYTYKSTHKMSTLEEAFDAHRKMTLEGRKRLSRKRKAAGGTDLADDQPQQQQQPPRQPQPQFQPPPRPLQPVQQQHGDHSVVQEYKEGNVEAAPCTQTRKELELLTKQLKEKKDELAQLGQTHSQLSRYCSLLEERLKVMDTRPRSPKESRVLSVDEWHQWEAYKQTQQHHKPSVLIARDEEMKCDVENGETMQMGENEHLPRPAPLVIVDDEEQWGEEDSPVSASSSNGSSVRASLSSGTSTPSPTRGTSTPSSTSGTSASSTVSGTSTPSPTSGPSSAISNQHESSAVNEESSNPSSFSTSHEVFTFARVKEVSNLPPGKETIDQLVVKQKCVDDDAVSSRSVMVEEQQSPRYSDMRGNNYDAWYRHLFLPRCGGEAVKKFFDMEDQQRLDISIDQMQLFCLPGIADSVGERKEFNKGLKVFRSLLVVDDQNKWKEQMERNVYNRLHSLSVSQPTEKATRTDRAFMVAFLRDSEEDSNSTDNSQASYILLEFACKTKKIYYYDVCEQLLEEHHAKLRRRERVMDFITAFRTHKKAQMVFEGWESAASVRFDVEKSQQKVLALSGWWCLSMLFSRVQAQIAATSKRLDVLLHRTRSRTCGRQG